MEPEKNAMGNHARGRDLTEEAVRTDATRDAGGVICMRRSRLYVVLLMGAMLAWMLPQQGCEPYGTVATADADVVSASLPTGYGDGSASLFLYRVKSRKTGERLGLGRSFRIEEERQVRAVLEMEGLTQGRALLLHLMWINPDGKKVFTKEIHVLSGDWTNEARQDSLKKQRVKLDAKRGSLELESRYRIGPSRFDEEFHKPEDKRTFKTGTWTVRAYLFRKLLLENSFELLPPK